MYAWRERERVGVLRPVNRYGYIRARQRQRDQLERKPGGRRDMEKM